MNAKLQLIMKQLEVLTDSVRRNYIGVIHRIPLVSLPPFEECAQKCEAVKDYKQEVGITTDNSINEEMEVYSLLSSENERTFEQEINGPGNSEDEDEEADIQSFEMAGQSFQSKVVVVKVAYEVLDEMRDSSPTGSPSFSPSYLFEDEVHYPALEALVWLFEEDDLSPPLKLESVDAAHQLFDEMSTLFPDEQTEENVNNEHFVFPFVGMSNSRSYLIGTMFDKMIKSAPPIILVAENQLDDVSSCFKLNDEFWFSEIPTFIFDPGSVMPKNHYELLLLVKTEANDVKTDSFLILRAQLGGKDEPLTQLQREEIDLPSNFTSSSSKELLGFIALKLSKFVSAHGSSEEARSRNRVLGIVVSHLVDQDAPSSCRAIYWTILNNDTSRTEFVTEINQALKKHDVKMQVLALVDDVVGNLAGGIYYSRECIAAVTLGMATNAAYTESTLEVKKSHSESPKSEELVINIGWGNFGSSNLPITEYDASRDTTPMAREIVTEICDVIFDPGGSFLYHIHYHFCDSNGNKHDFDFWFDEHPIKKEFSENNAESLFCELMNLQATNNVTEDSLVNFAKWEPRHGKFRYRYHGNFAIEFDVFDGYYLLVIDMEHFVWDPGSTLTLVLKGTWHFRQVVLSLLVIVWGLRLGVFLLMKILQWGEDRRSDEMRSSLGKLAVFWMFQAVWVWTVSLPVTIDNASDRTPTLQAVDIIGWIMWLLGVVVEATADQQKLMFRNSPDNRGKWCAVGIWKYSRHPNYFGEILLCGIPLLEESSDKKFWNVGHNFLEVL